MIRIRLTIDSAGTVPRRLTHPFTLAPIPDVRIARTAADNDATPVITTGQGV